MNSVKRYAFLSTAWLSLILGIIGIFVPILPTAPFIILAAFLFSKSDKRIYHLLLKNKHTGKMIIDWRDHRVINIKAKIFSALMIFGSICSMFVWMPVQFDWIKYLMCLILSIIFIFVVTRKSHKSVLIFLLFATKAFSAVELSANFWQSRQVYGEERESVNLSQTYAGSWAWYVFRYTAIEFGFSRTTDTITNNEEVAVDNSTTIVSSRNQIITDVGNVSLRQSLAPRTAFLVPAISLGYAKQWIKGNTRYVVDENGTSDNFVVKNKPLVYDSCVAGVSLRIRLTQLLGLTGSYRAVMNKCDTKYASDNTQVMAGLSWIF